MEIKWSIVLIVVFLAFAEQAQGLGLIKDLFQKATHTNNKTESTVKQSAPVCGSGTFSTPNEGALSPEIIFISNRPSRSVAANSDNQYNNNNSNNQRDYNGDNSQARRRNPSSSSAGRNEPVSEVAKEFSFHTENVTIEELERHGFNRNAPVSFLMHGFTSGYPLQAWISAIVEAYTIDRESGEDSSSSSSQTSGEHSGRRRGSSASSSSSGHKVNHNLFIINWNYAARGILYPRAVANIPIVASYVTRFINDKLLQQAGVNPRHIQLVGHSLGAHLAGFIGKNTKSKLGRIYGLDPAGPCFGTLAGPLYPSSKRLAPSDANEVISIHTNSALLGIDKPLGRYSVFVEGGESQPGCKGNGVLSSLGTLTWDGGDFDTVACSHSRAPNLLTYRHSRKNTEDDCQMVAYGCKDWKSFANGQCGVCSNNGNGQQSGENYDSTSRRAFGFGGNNSQRQQNDPLEPVECILVGLDWQYPDEGNREEHNSGHQNHGSSSSANNHNDYHTRDNYMQSSPSQSSSSEYNANGNNNNQQSSGGSGNNYNRRKSNNRNKRDNKNSTQGGKDADEDDRETTTRALGSNSQDKVEPISLFMRTADTQPYCTFHYQIVLELNEAFKGRGKPPMSIILQDSKPDQNQESRRLSGNVQQQQQQNSLSSDEFGNKFNDKIYTHLLTSSKKLQTVDHGTMIFRNGLEQGHRVIKALHINYMSHSDPEVRRRLSSRLCPVTTDTDRGVNKQSSAGNRFYFEPCDRQSQSSASSSSNHGHRDNENNYNNEDDNQSGGSHSSHGSGHGKHDNVNNQHQNHSYGSSGSGNGQQNNNNYNNNNYNNHNNDNFAPSTSDYSGDNHNQHQNHGYGNSGSNNKQQNHNNNHGYAS